MGTRSDPTSDQQQGNLWTVCQTTLRRTYHLDFLLYSSVFDRYIDDIFMTTNQTDEQINRVLLTAKTKDKNIEIESTIGSLANYLDVMIINDNGRLTTKIYHKSTAEAYYLPYTSDHPHRYHRNIPYSALVRAARLCSDYDDFNRERLRIDLTLLLSDYTPKMISNQFLRFFQVNHAELVLKQTDRQVYCRLHNELLNRKKTTTTSSESSIQQSIEFPAVLQDKPWDKSMMYSKHTFENGPRNQLSSEFVVWWKKHYQYMGSPLKNISVRLLPKTNPSLANFLVRKKPSRAILTRLEPTIPTPNVY